MLEFLSTKNARIVSGTFFRMRGRTIPCKTKNFLNEKVKKNRYQPW